MNYQQNKYNIII